MRWNGVALATGYLNTTQRVATIDASLVASAGFATVDVVNPGPVVSNSVLFTIVAPLGITTTSPLPSGLAGSAYFLALGATGGTGSRTWMVVPGSTPPPPGLTVSPGSGTITGIPTTPGAYRFGLRVTDSVGVFTEKTFDINIAQTGSTQGPDGQVGVPYIVTALAQSGSGPWTWQQTGGELPPGLTLNGTTGQISGTPTTAGTFFFNLMWTDSQELTFDNSFSIRILAAALTIPTNSPLPNGTVGVAYPQTTFAVTGGSSPYTWSFTGTLAPGLTLSTAGVLSGTPTQGGTFNFTVRVDASGSFTTKQFTLTVLAITTTSLPNGTAGTAYPQQTFAVNGGVSPVWSVSAGALPPGLSLSTAGVLSGMPTQSGTFNFTVRVDASGSFATKAFSLTVTLPVAPTASVAITDPSAIGPAQQPTFDVQLNAAYALTITGTVTLTFTPNAVNAANDPAIQFSGGGRTLNFTITAGQTRAFPTTLPSIQTGTVAGQIDLSVSYSAGGQNITPSPAPVRSVTVARAAPKINTVQVVRVAGGFNVLVTGFSTPRQVTQAVFAFTPSSGGNLQTTQVTIPVDPTFTTWYMGTSSPQFGSSFLYTQPFTVQGSVSDITSVSVTLSNATGTSTAVSANF